MNNLNSVLIDIGTIHTAHVTSRLQGGMLKISSKQKRNSC